MHTDIAAKIHTVNGAPSLFDEVRHCVPHHTGVEVSGVQDLERIRVRVLSNHYLAAVAVGCAVAWF